MNKLVSLTYYIDQYKHCESNQHTRSHLKSHLHGRVAMSSRKTVDTPSKRFRKHNEMNEIHEGNGMRGLREDLRSRTGLRTFNRGRVCEVWGQYKGSKVPKMSRFRCLRNLQISQDRQEKGKQANMPHMQRRGISLEADSKSCPPSFQ